MLRGIKRGLIVAVAATLLVALYVWWQDDPYRTFAAHLSTALFQIGLLMLMAGVVIFTRLSSYRRRMGLQNITAMFTSRTRQEYEEHQNAEDELNAKDAQLKSKNNFGRDITMLIAALVTIAVSVVAGSFF